MQLSTALLCDYAAVRDGLLFVVAGGVTQLHRPAVPSPLNVSLAVVVEFHRAELVAGHQLDVFVTTDDGSEVGRVQGGFQSGVPDPAAGEVLSVPVAFDLSPIALPSFGGYSIAITLDAILQRTLRFTVVEVGAPPPSPEPAADDAGPPRGGYI